MEKMCVKSSPLEGRGMPYGVPYGCQGGSNSPPLFNFASVKESPYELLNYLTFNYTKKYEAIYQFSLTFVVERKG